MRLTSGGIPELWADLVSSILQYRYAAEGGLSGVPGVPPP